MGAAEPDDHAALREVLARYMRAMRLHDVDLMDDVFTPDAVIDYTAIGGVEGVRGRTRRTGCGE